MGLKGLMDWAGKEQFRHNQEEYEKMIETCDKKRGSLDCEECDNWRLIKITSTSPYSYLELCELDRRASNEELKK
jgi:Ca2+-binding EF-hand superfamily protein